MKFFEENVTYDNIKMTKKQSFPLYSDLLFLG